MNINHVIINVSLVANPTLRETNTGTLVATATIANNEFFNDDKGERQQVTTFVDVTVRGESGENFASLARASPENALSPLLPPWQTGNPCFRFGKKNCALGGSFSLQNTNPKESWREGEDQGEHGRIPFVRDDGRLIKKQH